MQAYLRVAVQEGERATVIHVEGELDLGSAMDLAVVINRVRGRAGVLVIDLDELAFIDMAGLRVLVTAYEEARAEGRQFVLTNVREPVRRVLTLDPVAPLLPPLDGVTAA